MQYLAGDYESEDGEDLALQYDADPSSLSCPIDGGEMEVANFFDARQPHGKMVPVSPDDHAYYIVYMDCSLCSQRALILINELSPMAPI